VSGVLHAERGGEITGELGAVRFDGAHKRGSLLVGLAAVVAAESEAAEGVGGGDGGENRVAGGHIAGLVTFLGGRVFGHVEVETGHPGSPGCFAGSAGRQAGHALRRTRLSSR
jgi:hypothetical protein